ncbi:hypothetical protein ANN_22938 [Periplaneta americana]|uniref:Mos1 transposase HTH domain-containing protein n=1 Tax=Periplaneta americana TaxID=6978 RepID=A0ABQ8SK52_PERAM|nr:hypothetical protein ANN_22938 [Periplaneta americana]
MSPGSSAESYPSICSYWVEGKPRKKPQPVARGRRTQECFQGLREACADAALPYRTVARWVKAFREGRDGVQNKLRTGRPRVEDNTVQLLAWMLIADGLRKVRPTQSAVMEMFIVAYDIDGVILHHAVPPRADGKSGLLLQVPAAPPSSSPQEKTTTLGGPVAPLAMGDSGTSTVLTRYDPCDYDLFTKVKEPLRGTRYNIRDELIRALGRSIRNINKDGRADGVRRLPNIWQKVCIGLHVPPTSLLVIFFLWGFIKQQVYQPPLPPTIEDLRVRITEAIALVDGPMLQRVWQEIYYRFDVCRVTQGAHIEQM